MQEPNSLELRLEVLSEQLRTMEHRVAILEDRLGFERTEAAAVGALTPEDDVVDLPLSFDPMLIGRSFMVLGGAFLLRAVTEQPSVSDLLGLSVGLLYGLLFLYLAHRAAARGLRSSAMYHGVLAAMIAFPIVFEGRTLFGIFNDAAAALLLSALALAGLWVAARHRMQTLAWVVSIAVMICSVGLMFRTNSFIPYLSVLWLLSLGLLVISRPLSWYGLEWLPVSFMTLMPDVAYVFATGSASLTAVPALLSILMFPLLYIIAYAYRAMLRQTRLRPSEATRLAIAIVFGFGSAAFVAREDALAGAIFLSIAAVLAVVCYGLMLWLQTLEGSAAWRVVFYGSMGALLALLAIAFTPVPAHAYILLALAAWAVPVSVRKSMLVMRGNALLFGFSAAIASGLIGYSSDALFKPGSEALSSVTVAAIGVLIFFAIDPLVARRAERDEIAPRLMTGISLTISIWILAGLACAAIQQFVAVGDRAVLSTARTLSLIVLALIQAGLARSRRFAVAARLVYPIFIVTGAKIALEDVRAGTPATLFVTLGAYGVGLILASRMLKWSASRTADADAPPVVPQNTAA